MINYNKEDLISQWKMLRGKYYNIFAEDKIRFKKLCSHHLLYDSVVNNFDKDFKQVNQIVEQEIDKYLKSVL
jgi:hypothetical protein